MWWLMEHAGRHTFRFRLRHVSQATRARAEDWVFMLGDGSSEWGDWGPMRERGRA